MLTFLFYKLLSYQNLSQVRLKKVLIKIINQVT